MVIWFLRLVIGALLILQTSCVIVAPFVDAFKKTGATSADRAALLNQEIKKFSDALYWGKGEAAAFVHSDADPQLSLDLADVPEDRKIVSTKVKRVTLADNAFSATVDVVVQYYKIPYYVVINQREKQVWDFGFRSGWKLKERSIEGE